MDEQREPEHFFLRQLLCTSDTVFFIFRTGLHKHFMFNTKQYPLSNQYIELHKTALTKIPLLVHHDGTEYFVMVSAKNDNQVQRKEYIIKRAILDLKEQYGWEVKAW